MILARVCTIMYNSLCATIISTIACKVANHHKKETSFLIYIHIRIPLPPKVYFACSERKSERGKVIVKNSSQSKAQFLQCPFIFHRDFQLQASNLTAFSLMTQLGFIQVFRLNVSLGFILIHVFILPINDSACFGTSTNTEVSGLMSFPWSSLQKLLLGSILLKL